jgi:tRNA pseudouridine38-40 synthase
MRLLAECSYLGAFFMGWQRQSQGERTIQEEIEKVLQRLYKIPVGITVAGRTDTLVNARQQFFHFDPPFEIPLEGLLKGMNTLLPWDIRSRRFLDVPEIFHARKNVVSKTYVYRLQVGGVLSPFDAWTVHRYPGRLNVARMKKVAALFAGEHDFRPFTVQPETYHSTVRRVESVEIIKKGDRITFTVTAEGFMRYMVRRIVGTLVEVGRGAQEEGWVEELLKQPDKEAGPPIHASGLTLEGVVYPGLTSPYRDPIIPSGK